MVDWQTIETAPKDGTEVLCWAPGWRPQLLCWKHNYRLDRPARALTEREEQFFSDHVADYWGDPYEMDDYGFAKKGFGPTHWLSFPPFPAGHSQEL